MLRRGRRLAGAFCVTLSGCGPRATADHVTGAEAVGGVAPAATMSSVAASASGVEGRLGLAYPRVRRGDVIDDYGIRVPDPYRWLEDPDSAETRAFVDAENRLTNGYLSEVPERGRIVQRLRELYAYQRFRVPEKMGSRIFYAQSDGLQNQPILYVMDGAAAAPRVLFDPNALAADGTVSMNFWSPSDDGRLLAYGVSSAGSDWVEVRLRDVTNARDLPDVLKWAKFTQASWRRDGRGFFYSRYPEPPKDQPAAAIYFNKVYYHEVGTTQDRDVLVYERPDQKEWMFGADVTDDGKYVVLSVSKGSNEKNLVFVAKLGKNPPTADAFIGLVTAFEFDYEFVGSRGSRLWFRTNQGAPHGRVVAVDVARPSDVHWAEIVPEAPEALQSARWVGDRLVLTYLKDAHSEVRVHDLAGKLEHAVVLPGIGTVAGFYGRQRDGATFYSYASFTTPATIYQYVPATNQATVFRAPRLPYDPVAYETEQVFATSKDGTRVPIFLVHRKGLVKDGKTPTYLYGYGGFNISVTPMFDPAALEWVEMGGIYAVATLRGGGEYGKAWHEAGMKEKKQNVFDDFMAAARFLVSSGHTRAERLAIGGHSNGGLLVGACLTQHPELFGAALPGVGVMDMLRYHRFTIGWAWADEYGSSDDPADLKTLLAYSPLHNVRPGTRYPATLITTADHDDRVVPAHSFKFAAALQAAQGADAPVLIRIETRAGHGGATPTGKLLEEQADRWAFLVRALGFSPWDGSAPATK